MTPRHSRIRLAQADATALPYRDRTFDAVVCSETLEHIPNPQSAVEEIARVLSPRGLLFVTVPNLWNAARLIQMLKTGDLSIHLMPGHMMEYSPRLLQRLLSRWFVIERFYPVGFCWRGWLGGQIEWLIKVGILSRLSGSVACVARKR